MAIAKWAGLAVAAGLWGAAHCALASPAAATSVGPTSDAEAAILWSDGKAAFDEGRYKDATVRLQRLVDRYPGYPGYLEAQGMLGRAWMLQDQPKKACAPLAYYAEALRARAPVAVADKIRARLWLGRCMAETGKMNQAELEADETLKNTKSAAAEERPGLEAGALLLKARSALGRRKYDLADRSVESARDRFVAVRDTRELSTLKGEAALLGVELKTRECSLFPPKDGHGRYPKLDELQARGLFERRGSCLLESMLQFHDAVESGDSGWSLLAASRLIDAYQSYLEACGRPPDPPALRPTPRTRAQLQRYRAELADRVQLDCRAKIGKARELLAQWKGPAADQLGRALDALALPAKGRSAQ